ncbi:MAG: family 78 glycoside hydrolase catalytic domain [Fimbriimonadaceae bacterium]|nr:family 78 glycoside hydrolase catalytic domain [Fimbriimonadaceae bacterium]
MLGVVLALMNPLPAWQADWITVPTPGSAIERASWVWAQAPGEPVPSLEDAPAGVRWFRKSFAANPGEPATLAVAADNRATVWINGEKVGEARDWAATSRFRTGPLRQNNTILVRAENGKGVPGGNPGGLIAAIEQGDKTLAVSDGSWSSSLDEASERATKTVALGPAASAPWSLREPSRPPILRREFAVPNGVGKATVRVIGLGDFELRLNGHKVGGDVLDQPWSQYDRAIYWREFDVTGLLKPGANAFGAFLGASFWRVERPPAGRYAKGDAMPDFSEGRPWMFRLELWVEGPQGRQRLVATDREWTWAPSPILFSNVYAGEDVDARLESSGWDRPGFRAEWPSVTVARAPKAELRRQNWPGIRVHETWSPERWIERRPGVWSVVFPQNASGLVETRLRGKRGARVVLVPSEVMTDKGEVQQLNLWNAEASCAYTLRGGGAETWRWRFFTHGFRYVEVRGAVPAGRSNPQGLPVIEGMRMMHTRVAMAEAGAFACSSDLYNRTHALIDWAMRSNASHVLTDCPHREKLGWLECAHLLAPSFLYRYDAKTWFAKIARDIRDAQAPDGRIGTVAPRFLQLPYSSPYAYTVEWGAAGVLMPWTLYEWTGDRSVLAQSYASMRAFVDQIESVSPDGIAPTGLGDWYDYGHGNPPGPSRYTPTDLTSTATWAMCAQALAKAADVLEKPDDATRYRALHGRIAASFQAKFYDPVTKTCANRGSPQTANAMALCADLIPAEDRETAAAIIVANLEARDYQQTSGDVGHVFLIRALAEAGRSDVLHKVYSRTGLGSYGGILAKGLTTLPESWDALTVGSNSLNHCMLGHAMEWFYGWVLGIRQAPGSVGWREVVVAPNPGSLSWAKGHLATARGRIEVTWKRRGNGFDVAVTSPRGMAIRVEGPDGKPATDLGGGRHRIEG